ncbi:MAG: NAD-dependent epimerase/dehydratase family protein [Pseudomonadota bacterium]
MPPLPTGGTVAVTGAAGFIGGWMVRTLLDHGYRVRACVRNADDDARVAFLKAMPGFASGRLTLHSADLDEDGCFDDIFPGCHAVAHLSHVTDYSDQDYVDRVCGHIIGAIDRAETVSRVVVTSSLAAVISEVELEELRRRPVIYEDRYPDSTNPKRSAANQGYAITKERAEGLFAAAAAINSRWDSIACCPSDNVGPILAPHQRKGAWQHQVARMLEGDYEQSWAYRPWFPVDVRDCAIAHLGLLESTRVRNGERYLAWSTDAVTVETICARIATLLPELDFRVSEPRDQHPDKLKAREAYFRSCWDGCDLRNDRIRDCLGLTFRSFDESLRDCVESLISVAGVQSVQRG